MYQKQLISLQRTLSSLGIDFSIEEAGKKELSCFPLPKVKRANPAARLSQWVCHG